MKKRKKKKKNVDSGLTHHSEKHVGIGDLIKSMVFGGLDGIITTFAIVAASVASQFTFFTVLVVGIANLVGDALSMGLGAFFSSYSESQNAKKRYSQYMDEITRSPEEQKQKLYEVFIKKGFDSNESKRIVELLAENYEALADIMLLEFEGITRDDSSFVTSLKSGVVTFIAFIFFGALPLVSFCFGKMSDHTHILDWHFWVGVALTAISLFVLGMIQNILLNNNWFKGGVYMLLQGGISTLIAYGAGYLLELATTAIDK
mmetsp:Transcript_6965/g.10196  ORF Transcript_6965/g.10196 Transcript_6965/m.10196 type:complete len:260 (+) Transcript_6965:803-1582(+)